jgi:uncharacterized protein YprB with RNaseH-like and TPR domain
MLTNTFCHIPTIGTGTESRIWASGVRTWEDFRAAPASALSPRRVEIVKARLDESAAHLQSGNAAYFYEHLPSFQQWRLFRHFRESTAYLDIETTGLGAGRDHITTIALFDGRNVFTYVHGQNMRDFATDVRKYKLLVTYNGKQFDLPFIRENLAVTLDQAHIDLRFVLASLGYGGGLKGCERTLGLDRGDLAGVNGYFAVLLWQEFIHRKNDAALRTLLAYNVEDVVNLETLMVLAWNMKLADTPFAATHALPRPTRPEVPFQADMETVKRIARAYHLF